MGSLVPTGRTFGCDYRRGEEDVMTRARKAAAIRWQQRLQDVKKRWDRLAETEIAAVQGNAERLIDLLQVHYGYARNTAIREITLWSRSLRGAP
jgi:hypothetical protein